MWEGVWTHVGGGVDPHGRVVHPCGRGCGPMWRRCGPTWERCAPMWDGVWTHLVVAEHGHGPVGSVVRENLRWDTVRR